MKYAKKHLIPGPWFNIKMSSYQYRKSHCGDKTILRPSYLHNGISYTGKKTSLYWIRAQFIFEENVTPWQTKEVMALTWFHLQWSYAREGKNTPFNFIDRDVKNGGYHDTHSYFKTNYKYICPDWSSIPKFWPHLHAVEQTCKSVQPLSKNFHLRVEWFSVLKEVGMHSPEHLSCNKMCPWEIIKYYLSSFYKKLVWNWMIKIKIKIKKTN